MLGVYLLHWRQFLLHCGHAVLGVRKVARLRADRIPIERHWQLSMDLHKWKGCTEPWELCQECDRQASEAICILFDLPRA